MWLPSMFNLPKNIFQLADKSKIMVTIVLLHNNLVKQLEIKDEVTKKLSISSMMMRVISQPQYWSVWLFDECDSSFCDSSFCDHNYGRFTNNWKQQNYSEP